MTHRLVIGIDPGQSGAIALVADGGWDAFTDMPTMARKAGGNEVDTYTLAHLLREHTARHAGAYHVAVLEAVSAMPKQGVSSVFRFGESFGCVKGVLGALRIPLVLVAPITWKKKLGLVGVEKDVARAEAIKRFPQASPQLTRKKDVGRADALLIAHWAELTESVGVARQETIAESMGRGVERAWAGALTPPDHVHDWTESNGEHCICGERKPQAINGASVLGMNHLTVAVMQAAIAELLRANEAQPGTVFGLNKFGCEIVNRIDVLEVRVYARVQVRPGELLDGYVPIEVEGPIDSIRAAVDRLLANFRAMETHLRQVCC